jgi:hypothetical protein
MSRRSAVIAGAAALAIAVAWESAAPIVRARIAAVAQSRGLDVSVGHVGIGWFALNLKDVSVAPRGKAFASARIADVRVELSVTLRVVAVEAHRVEVRLAGTPEAISDAVRAWRGEARTESGTGAAGRARFVSDGVSLIWSEQEAGPPTATMSGGSVVRDDQGARLAFEAVQGMVLGHGGGTQIDATGVAARLDAHGNLADARASRVAIAWMHVGDEGGGADKTVAPEPSPPPLPSVSLPRVKRRGNGAKKNPNADGEDAMAGVRLPLPSPRGLRAKLAVLGALARDRFGEGGRVDVESLAFEVSQGDQRLTIGQGPLSIARKDDALAVSFRTRANANGTPLEVDATIPLEAGDATLSLAGGPVSLALLGVNEGAAGLVDVERTTVGGQGRVSLAASGDELTFDGDVGVRGLAIRNPRVAFDVVRGVDAAVVARGVLDDRGALRLDDAEVTLGAFHVLAQGTIEQTPQRLVASLAMDLPGAPCQSLLESIPSALVPTLEGAEATGTLGAHGRIAFDSTNLDDLVFDWNVEDRCSLTTVPEGLSHDRFSQPFEHAVYLPDGTLEVETTGPTTDAWTDLAHISPFMQVAVLTTEDGAFYKHRGFNRAAIRNALIANLKAGRFVRGASTITMQLAKNLFLSREKTLARKLEELILADYLEQAFTKKEIIELYLNVIEFGPDLYGITKAADHYFGRKPAQLNLAECMFLSSLLPSPLRFSKLADKPALSEGWTKHLHDLINIAARLGTISPEEAEEGLKEVVAFHDPKDPPPAPRPPVTGTHFEATHASDDADWEATP